MKILDYFFGEEECIACKYSGGPDEREWYDHGCPDCICGKDW